MKSFTFAMLMSFSFSAMAVCSQTTKVCADYQTSAPFSVNQEGRFELTVKDADLVSVDLWMQMGSHGHGSSPLKVTQVSPGIYDVTKAFFVMKGKWQIRVTYKLDSVKETLIIPVDVK
ncbi:MAG: FixH family protein [Bdellovibrionota bacterium]